MSIYRLVLPSWTRGRAVRQPGSRSWRQTSSWSYRLRPATCSGRQSSACPPPSLASSCTQRPPHWARMLLKQTPVVGFSTLPFDVDVTHVLSSDAGLIQSHVSGVPDDHTQEMPGKHSEYELSDNVTQWWRPGDLNRTYFLALRGVMSKGGPGRPMVLGKTSTHIWRLPWMM